MSKTNARPREKRSGVVLFTVGGGGDVYGRANRQSSSGVPDVAGCQSFTVGRTFAICWLPVINRWPDVAVCRLAVRSQSTGRFPSPDVAVCRLAVRSQSTGRFPSAGLAVAHKQPDVAICRLAFRSQSAGRFPSTGLAAAHKQPDIAISWLAGVPKPRPVTSERQVVGRIVGHGRCRRLLVVLLLRL